MTTQAIALEVLFLGVDILDAAARTFAVIEMCATLALDAAHFDGEFAMVVCKFGVIGEIFRCSARQPLLLVTQALQAFRQTTNLESIHRTCHHNIFLPLVSPLCERWKSIYG